MILYSEETEESEKIYEQDIQFMAGQLEKFVELYRKKVYMYEEEQVQALNYLEQITKLMKNKQYGVLINDTSIIDYDLPPLDDWPF